MIRHHVYIVQSHLPLYIKPYYNYNFFSLSLFHYWILHHFLFVNISHILVVSLEKIPL